MADEPARIALVTEVFDRISSGGARNVEDLFAPDGVYEGAYAGDRIAGARAIGIMLGKVIPAAISPFRQWPIGVTVAADGLSAAVEYRSQGRAVHDGSDYANLYVGVMRFAGDRIAWWREYYDNARFMAAVGPDFGALVARWMPAGSMVPKGPDLPVAGPAWGGTVQAA